ncbi:AAA family ATPase [Marinicella gelatinilytica]|uniref:AAA family ATPase n=1 Tax=Marinicella gelatinilytica TaxID=2996017 RepID=UPI002260D62F|nr:AAA family ATPase [Marinicella gelatinilytica]MCX7544947.1 AAA family ATPase [Marinicella gelatinilytica]
MYLDFFNLNKPPFAITPDPAFVYLSEKHNESLAHLVYGVTRGGGAGFVQLTGEVGTGKTTLSRLFLQQLPKDTHAALILNPNQSAQELLVAIFREFGLSTHGTGKQLDAMINRLNEQLLQWWEQGENALIIIDEAQNLPQPTLEQLRLLTNLETAEQKLLQIILIGQPELKDTMARKDLRQLAQRITTRFHLQPLNRPETHAYIRHRMAVSSLPDNNKNTTARQPLVHHREIFTQPALNAVYRHSQGIPRLINILCDRALLVAYTQESPRVRFRHIQQAQRELHNHTNSHWYLRFLGLTLFIGLAVLSGWYLYPSEQTAQTKPETKPDATTQVTTIDAPPVNVSWQRYFKLWQLETGLFWPQLDCPDITLTGMACYHKQGNLSQIAALNTPVILQLNNQSAVLLTGLTDHHVTISTRQGPQTLSQRDLNAHWLGHYRVLWPIAPALIDGTISEQQQWALSVAQILGNQPDLSEANLTPWIKNFQQQNGLHADGIIGSETQMALALKAYDGPQLNQQTAAVSDKNE